MGDEDVIDPCAEGNGGALAARLAEVWADRDAARTRELNAVVKGGGTCRYCKARLSERVLSRHPGVCGLNVCVRRAVAEQERSRVVHAETAAPQREERPSGTAPSPAAEVVHPPAPSSAPAQPEQPAKPAEEIVMAAKCEQCGGEVRPWGGKVTQPCRKCRAGETPEARAEKAASAKKRTTGPRLEAPALDLVGSGTRALPGRKELEAHPARDLLALRGALDDVLAELLQEVEGDREAIRSALGMDKAESATRAA